MFGKKLYLVLFAFFISWNIQGQQSLQAALNSPHNTVYTHLFYLQDDSYRPEIAAQVIPQGRDSLKAIDLSIKLKQILDGQGLYVHLNRIPSEENYLDSLTKRNLFVLFPKELPEVYLEKSGSRWYWLNRSRHRWG